MPLENQQKKQESKNATPPSTMIIKAGRLLGRMTKGSFGIVAKIVWGDKPFYRRWWLWAGLSVGGGVMAFNYGIAEIDRTLPDKSELNAVMREQTLTIKAADGSILQQQGEATREKLKLSQIPDLLEQAFIASEDRRFAEHNGIDAQGIARALWNNVRSQDLVEGGSTITQQLARILFLDQERTFWRKAKEMRLAQKIETELTKDEILERYLNLVYLGAGAYGVADAAWVYFSKPVDQLTLAEIATLAGLAPAPSVYAPDRNPEAALTRRNLVLERMEEDGFITADQKVAALQEPLKLKTSLPKRLEVKYPYFTTYIQQELPQYVSQDVLAGGGLVVETSLNPQWQKNGEEVVKKILENQGRWENFKEAALVAIDPRNGEIRAMVGGRDFAQNQFNRVTQAQRQPGSTFKGFVYAAAIASGKSPYDSYLDAPLIIDGYEPKNASRSFSGWLTIRDALTQSVNTIAVKVMLDVGFDPTIKLAQEMGIKSPLKKNYSLALGSNEVNLLELTSAYGTFAAKGYHTPVHGIRRILNRKGEVIWTAKVNLKPKKVLDADSAAIMTWMLSSVVQSGTGRPANLGNRPVAGKTGTTDNARDLWFIGYIPQVVTGVWLGNDDNRPTWGTSTRAAYTWHEFMEEIVAEMPVEKFPARPKLTGRVASIKAQPIKPKKLVNKAIAKNDDDDDDNANNEPIRRRRRIYSDVEQSSSNTPRRRRRSQHQQENVTPRRQRIQQARSESESPRRQPQNNSGGSRTTSDTKPVKNTPVESAPPKRSWRERLKPATPPPASSSSSSSDSTE